MNKLKKEVLIDKETKKFLEQIAGPIANDVVLLFNKKPLTPEDISNKLKEKITTVRSTLNSLHYRGIACYKKERDKQNMYEFKWEIKYKKILENLLIREMKKFQRIENEINEKNNRDFFYCKNNCDIELAFENAAPNNFKCPNCGDNLELVDSKKKITSLKRKKTKIKKNINKLEEIIEKINDNTKGYVCE